MEETEWSGWIQLILLTVVIHICSDCLMRQSAVNTSLVLRFWTLYTSQEQKKDLIKYISGCCEVFHYTLSLYMRRDTNQYYKCPFLTPQRPTSVMSGYHQSCVTRRKNAIFPPVIQSTRWVSRHASVPINSELNILLIPDRFGPWFPSEWVMGTKNTVRRLWKIPCIQLTPWISVNTLTWDDTVI